MSIQVGQVVRVKAAAEGVPNMTVNRIYQINDLEIAECVWFDKDSVLHTGDFATKALVSNSPAK